MTAFLLDTHALFWAFKEPHRISPAVKLAILDSEHRVYATLVSAQEMANKITARAWPEAIEVLQNFDEFIELAGFGLLVPTATDHLNSTLLPDIHKDPHDRLIVAMAIARGMVLVTSDHSIEQYPVEQLYAGNPSGERPPRARERLLPESPLTPIPLDA